MQKSSSNDSTTHNVEVFCHMILEEFLTTRNMHSTLRAFRKEWERPNEDVTIFSWYNLILKLQMSELQHDTEKDENHTVLESIVKALAKESSIRTRRPMEVTMNGMTTMPKASTLPYLSDPLSAPPAFENKSRHNSPKEKKPISTSTKTVKTSTPSRIHHQNSNEQLLIPSKLERIDKFGNGKVIKTSTENWLPDTFRMKSRLRELALAQETLDSIIVRELDQAREHKRISVPVYDRALNEESLSMVKKHPCGCCLQRYLYVNLPLRVSQKAIIDIRVKWTGSMTSATIFSGTRTMTAAASVDAGINPLMLDMTQTMNNNNNNNNNNNGNTNNDSTNNLNHSQKSPTATNKNEKKTSPIYQKMHVSRSSISVYDQVLVCLFCSQFFQDQDEYRPSYADMVTSERRAAHLMELERERQYWDPLMMIDKDKKEEEDEKEKREYEALLAKSSQHAVEESIDLSDRDVLEEA